MLQVIISPAKQMRVARDAFAPWGVPPHPAETKVVADALRRILRDEGPEGLRAIWRVSDRLLAENVEHLRAFAGSRDLYDFWGDRIAGAVCAGDGAPVVVNLASREYARAVLPRLPERAREVTCLFGEALRAGRPVQRATASKIARGSMVRWMAEHQVEDARDLVRFDVGYRFAPELSSQPDDLGEERRATLVFLNASL